MTVGDWVDLGDGRVASVKSWDESTGLAVAELPSGEEVDRQISFASLRWQLIREDGLRVAAAVDRAALLIRSEDAPVEIVVMALKDLGGRGETREIRNLITSTLLTNDVWDRWWRKTQIKLEEDERIDASRARDKVYSLPRPGGALGKGLVPALQDATRRGRRMADGPQLKHARDRAQRKVPTEPSDQALFEAEIAIAGDQQADPTDRFMAAELGTWLGRWPTTHISELLQDDLHGIDVLRIPGHASRDLALDLAFDHPREGASITYRSALAAGSPWADRVITRLSDSLPLLRSATFGLLGWSVPGDEDAGPARLKEDIPTYERRIERAAALVGGLTTEGRLGVWDGGLHAIRSLPHSATYATSLDRIRQSVSRLCWSVYSNLHASVRAPLRDLPAMDRDAFAPLIRNAPADASRLLRPAVLEWYVSDPTRQLPNLRLLADSLGEDVLALGLEAAQGLIRKSSLVKIAPQLFHVAIADKRMDKISAGVVNLAVTASGDDPTVNSALDRLAEAIVEGYIAGATPVPGPITFSHSSWERFNALVSGRIEDAREDQARARVDADKAKTEAARSQELADERARALSESRSSSASGTQQDVQRLASNLLKPVALALADSFEGRSIEALQDRLLAVLQRARILPVLEVGDTAPFDPTRHTWVGEGSPTSNVTAKSPGFAIQEAGGDVVVLVPARVVGPR